MNKGSELYNYYKDNLGKLKVLYVEDNRSIRNSIGDLLSRFCEEVYLAKDGYNGYEVFLENMSDIDIVITDINMPNMNGIEMLDLILDIKPKLAVVIVSVYGKDDIIKNSRDNIIFHQQKPLQDVRLFLDNIINEYLKYSELKKSNKK